MIRGGSGWIESRWKCTWDRIVAPSFVTVMSPSGEMRILSRPRGPREVRTIPATVFAARMCDLTASFPCCLFFLPWSLTMMKGRPFSSLATWAEGGMTGLVLFGSEFRYRGLGSTVGHIKFYSDMSARGAINYLDHCWHTHRHDRQLVLLGSVGEGSEARKRC